jgi:hypothetical protein
MSCILYHDDEEIQQRINIDDLYEKNKKRDLKQISIFNKILGRIHKRILYTNRSKQNDKHIWFIIPEYILGEPLYDQGDCIAYIISKLEENGFFIKYMHPNTLFISWHNWIPSYVRNEIKKKQGVIIDERGNIVDKIEVENNHSMDNRNTTPNGGAAGSATSVKKQYNSTEEYKPTGKFNIYGNDMFEKLEKRVSFK